MCVLKTVPSCSYVLSVKRVYTEVYTERFHETSCKCTKIYRLINWNSFKIEKIALFADF